MLKKLTLLLAAAICIALACGNIYAADGADFLIRVEKQSPKDRNLLLDENIYLIGELSRSLFVLGDKDDMDFLARKGYEALIIDSAPTLSDYFIVGTRPDSDIVLLKGAGEIIYSEENVLLLRVPLGYGLAPLYDAKVFVSPMRKEPVRRSLRKNEIQKKLDGRNELFHVDPLVQKMVNSVDTADIASYWSTLTTTGGWTTRYSSSAGCDNAVTYSYNLYSGLGLSAEYQDYNPSYAPNAIGTITGAVNPDEIYILVGHIDDLPSSGAAPGADDNASGVVAGYEAAQIMSCYAFKNTVKFIAVTGEEQGLYGSEAYAAAHEGDDIQGVIAFDMPGWEGDTPGSENLDLNYNSGIPGSQALGLLFAACAADYSTGLVVDAFDCPSLTASDHAPFWDRNFAAVCGITDNEGYCGHGGNYPYYHQVTDTIANCGDPSFFYAGVKATIATLAELGEPFKITLDKTSYGCTVPVTVIVGDRDLNTNSSTIETVAVNIWSTRESTPESLVLTEQGVNSMIFKGTMNLTGSAPVHGDGYLSVNSGDTITSQYVDAQDCDGGMNVTYTATGTVSTDCTPPVISNVAVTNLTGTTATVTWTTNESANSRVTYGTSIPPGTNRDDLGNYVTSHSVNLTGLTPCSQYYFSVTSADAVGNSASDNNGGSYYTFSTVGASVTVWSENFTSATPTALPAGWSESHTSGNAWVTNASGCAGNALMYPYNGSAAANSYAYTPGITLTAGMTYTLSFNQKVYSASYPEIFEVKCGSAATPAGQTITVLASASYTNTTCQALSGNFTVPTTGTYYLSFHCTSVANMWNLYIDDIVLSRPGTCGADLSYQSNTYEDSCGSGGAGNGDTYIDPGESITVHPVLLNSGGTATGISATLSTTTPGITVTTATASYPNIAPLGTASCNAPHFVYSVGSGVACGTVIDFTLTITAAGGGPWTGNFTHTVGNVIPGSGTAYLEDFENVATWTNWTVTTGPGPHTCGPFARVNTASQRPTTGSGYYALSDSDACGSGATTSTILTSPVINCSNASWTAVTLEYDIYYNYYNGDDATVQVYNGSAWQTVWTDTNADLNAHQSINVTTHALGNANFRVRFSYQNASWDYWYAVDNVKVSYTAPPGCSMTACAGGCTNPTKPAISSVLDNDPDVQDGVTVTFSAGSPSTSNSLLVDAVETATGITSPYVYDPGDTASHSYVVRTYNTASCHTDSDPVACTDEEETAVVPGEVASGGNFTWSGQTMNWTADANATGYRVYRGLLSNLSALCDATNDFCLRNDGAGTSLDVTGDNAAGASGRCFYYLITGYSGAGEGPAGTATCGARQVNSPGGCS